jgi:hypothetical protein
MRIRNKAPYERSKGIEAQSTGTTSIFADLVAALFWEKLVLKRVRRKHDTGHFDFGCVGWDTDSTERISNLSHILVPAYADCQFVVCLIDISPYNAGDFKNSPHHFNVPFSELRESILASLRLNPAPRYGVRTKDFYYGYFNSRHLAWADIGEVDLKP